tara:strand:+ start:321 stop:797 length:477 start_codon:yes stop_codon:yes gene_type:complete
MEDVDWLQSMLSKEREVRPPGSKKSEQRYLDGNCVKLYDNDRIVAYAEMRRVGSHVEISTVLVDHEYRNNGFGKRIIEEALENIKHSKVMACTKNPAMAKVLDSLGFKVTKWPGFWTNFILSINTIKRLIAMLIRFDFKRIWQQGKGIHKYDQFEIIR